MCGNIYCKNSLIHNCKFYTVCLKSHDPCHIVSYYGSRVLGHTVFKSTVCPRSSDTLYIVTYCIKWVTTSWTNSTSRIFVKKGRTEAKL